MMLKGGALLISILISFLLGIITFFLIVFGYLNQIEISCLQQKDKLIRNVNSGISVLLNDNSESNYEDGKIVDLFSRGTDSVYLKRKSWGLFEVATVKAFLNSHVETKSFLLGLKNNENIALYLSDEDQPLNVAGNTKITGLCYLPKSGVKRATVDGQSYTGSQLIYGEVKESSREVPGINIEQIKAISEILAGDGQHSLDSVVSFDLSGIADSIQNDFLSPLLLFYSSSLVELNDHFIKGNVIILSKNKVKIKSSCIIKDIIVIAPQVEIEEAFEGSLQVFASDSILVGENVKLNYPSVLALIENKRDSFEVPKIILGKGVVVEGSLISSIPRTKGSMSSLIRLSEDSFIKGEIVSTGGVDIKGRIEGKIFCQSIFLQTSSSTYLNHLLNVKIDSKIIPQEFAFSLIRKDHEKSTREIIKYIE